MTQTLAERLGISEAAAELARSSEIIDLHLDTFIARRIFGYDFGRSHGRFPLFGQMMRHVDLPRAQEAGLTGAMWSITTNPFRSPPSRLKVLAKNIDLLEAMLTAQPEVEVVRTHAQYRAARARGKHAAMLSLQGGNALEGAPNGPLSLPDDRIVRITVMHLTNSVYGATSSPFPLSTGKQTQLTERGRQFVSELNQARIFVDLAHIHPRAFWDAVEVHDKSQPLIDTHTGVSAVTPSWRNLDDDQLEAIANTGGVVGIIFHREFLKRPGFPMHGLRIIDHLKHVLKVVGEKHVAIGSDFDGMIFPPSDVSSVLHYPRLVQYMLNEGLSERTIQCILGESFLAAFERLRP